MRNGISTWFGLHENFSYTFPQNMWWAISNNPNRQDQGWSPPTGGWCLWLPITPRGQWGFCRESVPHSPSWVSECHWPYPESPTSWGSNCFFHTKKTLSEGVTWPLRNAEVLTSSTGQRASWGWGTTKPGAQGVKGWVGLLLEEAGFRDTGHPVSPGSPTQPLAYLSALRLINCIFPYLAGCLSDLPKT